MRSGQPAVTVKLVVIETKLADQLRTLRAAAFQSGADVENHQTIMPVGEIRQTIFHIKIVQVAARMLRLPWCELSTADSSGSASAPTSFGFFTSAKSITRIEPVASSVR